MWVCTLWFLVEFACGTGDILHCWIVSHLCLLNYCRWCFTHGVFPSLTVLLLDHRSLVFATRACYLLASGIYYFPGRMMDVYMLGLLSAWLACLFIGGGFPDCFRIRFPFASFVHLVLGFPWVALYPWFPLRLNLVLAGLLRWGCGLTGCDLRTFAHDWQSDPCFLFSLSLIPSEVIAPVSFLAQWWPLRMLRYKEIKKIKCPAALFLGLPPQKSQERRVQMLSCSFLTGPATKKSKIADCSCYLQPSCWTCQKVSSSQIAVAALQPSCWACGHKNLKQSDCSCPAALFLGLPPKISKTQSAVAILQLSSGPATKESKIVRLQLLPYSLLAGPTAKKNSSSQIAVATVAFLILNGPAVQKISSSQIAVAALQLSCWACRLKNFKYADCSCSAAFLLKRKIWSRSVQAKNFEIDATQNQIRANQHCQ